MMLASFVPAAADSVSAATRDNFNSVAAVS